MEKDWQNTLDSGEVLLIDGGMGTQLQANGVEMNKTVWSGAAVLTDPDMVRKTHEDFINAGADVIITNTFGSTRQMLEPAGYGDQVGKVHRDATRLAIEARNKADRPIAIAGSISTEPPSFDRDAYMAAEQELAAYREAAGLLKEAGVDIIALEMMSDGNHGGRAMTAALETGLPVWLGVSCKKDDAGRIVSFDFPDIGFEEVLDALIPMGPTVVNVMHSEIEAIPEAIEMVKARWSGPVGVYPESGYFTRPNWNFVDIISPEDLVVEAKKWIRNGVRLIGGCCGIGTEHIVALKAAMPELQAARN